jgi:hypothetical protein
MSTKRPGRTAALIVGGAILALVALSLVAQALISPGKGRPVSSVPQSALKLIRAVDDAELCAHGATGHYTSNLEDLNVLSTDSLVLEATQAHLALQVVAGQSGRNYFARVTGHGADTYVNRRPNFVDYGDSRRLGNRCPYPLSIAKRRLVNG